MNKILFQSTIILTLFINCSFGQANDDTISSIRNISVEIAGNGFIYSLKYENSFFKNNSIRYDIGLSYNPIIKGYYYDPSGIGLLPEIIYLFGKNKNKFEIGGGLNYFITRKSINYSETVLISEYKTATVQMLYLNLRLGYRYELEKNIFCFDLVPINYINRKTTYSYYNQIRNRVFTLGLSYRRII